MTMALETWDMPFVWMAIASLILYIPLLVYLPKVRLAIPIPLLLVLGFSLWMAYRPSMYSVIGDFSAKSGANTETRFEVRIEPWLVYSGETFWLSVSPDQAASVDDTRFLSCEVIGLNADYGSIARKTRPLSQLLSWAIATKESVDLVSGSLKCDESMDSRGVQLGAEIVQFPIEIGLRSKWRRMYFLGMLGVLVIFGLIGVIMVIVKRRK